MRLLLMLVLIARCLADFLTDLAYVKSCNETSPITLETLNDALMDRNLSGGESSDFNCFLFCLFTKYRWMDQDGGFFVHEMKANLEEAHVKNLPKILYECTAVDSFDKCERALSFARCFLRNTQEKDEDDRLLYRIVESRK